jgi:hypothetical protein
MANPSGVSVENNFSKGLITQATGLNFPENACTETENCVFNLEGSVERRLGFDFEQDYTTKTIDRADKAVTSYTWRNVSGDGGLTLFVLQVGLTFYFYKTNAASLSAGAIVDSVTLSAIAGADTPSAAEAQFADGLGYLIITHPHCNPVRVSYDSATEAVTETSITIKIRDFEGATADSLTVDERPTSTLAALTVSHRYNLLNQGWSTDNLTTWDTGRTDMPSNSDVMWRFKNSSDAFDIATVANVVSGNSRAPGGHYILTLSNMDRDTASGLTGVAATTTSFYRPSACAFFAGRMFYAGINSPKVNSNIYFTQIIEREDQYGACHQVNDPTSEDLFDLLPSDGGVISIPEAGTVYKLHSVPGGLAVMAANGCWYITGSTGLGFTANDYTVQKISKINAISGSSFVDVTGYPAWWNNDGIYILTSEGGTVPVIKSITEKSIKDLYDTIPFNSKKYAKGFYNNIVGTIQWVYNTSGTIEPTQIYEYDSILNFDTRLGSFYSWTISDSNVKLHGVFTLEALSSNIVSVGVIDGSSNVVIDGSGNNVVIFRDNFATDSFIFKYLVSYATGGSYAFTFAEEKNTSYLDWFTYDSVGVDYTSFFVTGYKLRGEGLRNYQPNWVGVFSKVEEEVRYTFRGLWGYANTSSTNKWSTAQTVTHSDTNFTYARRRLRVRGLGPVLQYKVTSVTGYPFYLIGWTVLDVATQTP